MTPHSTHSCVSVFYVPTSSSFVRTKRPDTAEDTECNGHSLVVRATGLGTCNPSAMHVRLTETLQDDDDVEQWRFRPPRSGRISTPVSCQSWGMDGTSGNTPEEEGAMTTNKVRRVLGFGPRSSKISWSSRGCQRATRAISNSSLSDVNDWPNRSDARQDNLRGLKRLVLVRRKKSTLENESVLD
ncbi:uncharacterized protein K489DRAFT_400138 [Dissoconium aciculare CBS 342.82]|uniref:Uncharacterized protein n=1 Tax=Dissoconium aciculare CBS 342.82 TaxID=1314786 RepID=A0A6J3MBM6_9PEZI|nr:uncharacterized protein K489DRAFT_400138 [Dissoconium aciculare CBS 342.82]KAF1824237.1 hypothetical protein K489DRAFT_400138 [Dissoconium aciculare CBS 342.82]